METSVMSHLSAEAVLTWCETDHRSGAASRCMGKTHFSSPAAWLMQSWRTVSMWYFIVSVCISLPPFYSKATYSIDMYDCLSYIFG